METKVYKIENINRDQKAIRAGAALIRQGQTVAFPTETVYGLGANALDGQAVNRIFKAKGRPNDNPLIVHIADPSHFEALAHDVSARVPLLVREFWPGPLTIILKKSPRVPPETTAGLDTVALRMPNHPIALSLIQESGTPIAAPSANRSGRPSPTTAQHVLDDLSGRIPMILDGITPCRVGLESTVLDMSGDIPTILRPGGITPGMLEKVLGHVKIDGAVLEPLDMRQAPRSPGMKYNHYSPRAHVIIYRGQALGAMVGEIKKIAAKYQYDGQKVGILATDETMDRYREGLVISLGSRREPAVLAANLFASLREFENRGVDVILAEWVDEREEGLAIMNRMVRAAGFHVVDIEKPVEHKTKGDKRK
ncbi:MAG: threonylcarbamoyl-AMP synthase [Clostridiales bacterium]|nr:threonylcarbamoyl-AMP synthase [Clostridiales bacterium]